MKNIIAIIFCFLFFACVGTDKPEKPTNLIAKDKMQDILYDLYIINGAKGVNGRLLEDNGFIPETYVLEKYSIDSLQFATSNNYYAFDTEGYKNIIDNVKEKLEIKKEELEELEKEEGIVAKRRRDSIKEVNKKNRDSLRKILGKQKDSVITEIKNISVSN